MAEITVFAKKRQSMDGRVFYVYVSRLTKKDGTEQPVSVKFQDKIPTCPANIIVKRDDCNLSRRRYRVEATGEERESFTLWVKSWEYGSAFVDHSLDEYEF